MGEWLEDDWRERGRRGEQREERGCFVYGCPLPSPSAKGGFAVRAAVLPKFIIKNAIKPGLGQGSRNLGAGLAQPGPHRRSQVR